MPTIRGTNLPEGGHVATVEQAVTYLFSWAGTAPTSPPATLASFATAWAANTSYTVGAVVKGSDGRAYGCTKAGTSALSPATGPSGSGGSGAPALLLCSVNLPTILDGTVSWLPLSGPGVVQSVYVINRGAGYIDIGTLATVAAGSGAGVSANGSWDLPGGAPQSVYLVAASGLAFSVTVHV